MVSAQGPSHLATRVAAAIRGRNRAPIDRASLARLFADLYAASFQTEEGHPVEALVVVARPSALQGAAVQNEDEDRWQPWLLSEQIPFSVENFAKLARATDARSSAICVEITADATVIWGVVDQQDKPFGSFVWDLDSSRPVRPGRIQIAIEGIAHLSVWIGYEKIAELFGSSLLPPEIDVFSGGPIREVLTPAFDAAVSEFQRDLSMSNRELASLTPALGRIWFGAIRRILARTAAYRSGGALLISPDETLTGLSTGYGLSYNRVNSAIEARWTALLSLNRNRGASAARSRALELRETARSELDGATRLVSLLTRVDGVVVLSPSLEVRRFGSRIQTPETPPAASGNRVPLARNQGATRTRISSVAYDLYGTRHQSVLRYCQFTPGAVGLIVSHDGAIRAATRIGPAVTLWDRVLLRRETRRRRGRPPTSK